MLAYLQRSGFAHLFFTFSRGIMVLQRKEGTVMKNYKIVHRIKLKDYDLRVLVNILNETSLRAFCKNQLNRKKQVDFFVSLFFVKYALTHHKAVLVL